MDEKYNLYDKLVSANIMNVVLASKKNGKIILDNFNPNDIKHLYMLKMSQLALMYPDIERHIYLKMGLFKYLIFKIKNKGKYNFKRYIKTSDNDNLINIERILKFSAEAFNREISIFEDIYKEYYL